MYICKKYNGDDKGKRTSQSCIFTSRTRWGVIIDVKVEIARQKAYVMFDMLCRLPMVPGPGIREPKFGPP